MQYIANAEEAKEIDGISINKMGIPSCVLMERASLKVADCVCCHATKEQKNVLVLCGVGNNGGDGVAAGRILSERGFQVTFVLIGSEKKASEEMRTQLAIARNLSLPVITGVSLEEFLAMIHDKECIKAQISKENSYEKVSYICKDYSIVIDAIFGIGLSRDITGEYANWIHWLNQIDATIFSVDIPSGIDASTGKVLGTAVNADYTITFGVNKLGLVLFPGTSYAGKVFVEDIGFPKMVVEKVSPKVISYDREEITKQFPKRVPRSNKGSYGKLLVIAGSAKISGAAYFAAKAAYLMGSGLVHIVTHENNRTMLQTKLPEALLTVYNERENNQDFDRDFQAELHENISHASAVVIGPGIGQSATANALLDEVMKIKEIPVLIDADGLNVLAKREEYFDDLRKIKLPDNFILTPHLKEMSRLTNKSLEDIKEHMIDMASGQTYGATIVLKDARTVISDGRQIAINQSGNNALAKGGSGDVLSGMIGGLLARGTVPFQAATLGVYLHGLTAEEYVKDKSNSSMLATDILNQIPNLLP